MTKDDVDWNLIFSVGKILEEEGDGDESKLIRQEGQDSKKIRDHLESQVDAALEELGVVWPCNDDDDDDDDDAKQERTTSLPIWFYDVDRLSSHLIPLRPLPTTHKLARLSSLPNPVRQRLGLPLLDPQTFCVFGGTKNTTEEEEEEEDVVVEVPLDMNAFDPENAASYYRRSETTSGSGGGGGGMTSKLSQYTKEHLGPAQNRGFRLGGSGGGAEGPTVRRQDEEEQERLSSIVQNSPHEKTDEKKEEENDDTSSPEAIQASRSIVDRIIQSSQEDTETMKRLTLEAFQDGLLKSHAPGLPGAGITPTHVYGATKEKDDAEKAKVNQDAIPARHESVEEDTAQSEQQETNTLATKPPPAAPATTQLWTEMKFDDDDSLFGDDDDDDDDDEEEEEEEEEASEKEEEEDEEEGEAVAEEKLEPSPASDQDEEPLLDASAAEQQVDSLLQDIDFSTQHEVDKALAKRTEPVTTAAAKKKKKAADRKSWAVTKPLSIPDFYALVPNPAITYPFELDDFQKQAVVRQERNECIFVAAHTSAGKTVCAEYAIALCQSHCTRAVYTSPIKALSNQKFRDFSSKFGDDVGLITGDLQVRPDASCLIMTTEILRSMLYRGADLVRDIEWVIFDEVHYVNDAERGVVWEEVIIMLPDYVKLIFLSATTPNTIEFSDWIGRTKRKPVHVIRTDYRPVPLSHHLWAGKQLHKILEGKSGFLEKGYREGSRALIPPSVLEKAEKAAAAASAGGTKKQAKGLASNVKKMAAAGIPGTARLSTGSRDGAWQQAGDRQDWINLVNYLYQEELTPTVVFVFSKKKCEELAGMLRTVDLSMATERNAAHFFADQMKARLSPLDAKLPQVQTVCEMVRRGIAVHHGGLLPILKETVEILFSRNIIKVLFATETFAMGVNMPARSVVFHSIRKHDGTQFRALEPGEYTQMAGRAGRRGIDNVGTVVITCFGETPPPQPILKTMLTGSSTKLQSQFRLTYNMILNLLRVEDLSVEGMMKRSFSEFATQRALSSNNYATLLERGVKTLRQLEASFPKKSNQDEREGAEDVEEYHECCTQVLAMTRKVLAHVLSHAGMTGGGSLVAGRVLLVTAGRKHGVVRAPAIILKSPSQPAPAGGLAALSKLSSGSNSTFDKKGSVDPVICMLLLPPSYNPSAAHSGEPSGKTKAWKQVSSTPKTLNYVGSKNGRHYAIRAIEMEEILLVSSVKHKVDSEALYTEKSTKGSKGAGGAALSNMLRPKARQDDFFGGKMMAGKTRGLSAAPGGGGGGGGGAGASAGAGVDETFQFLLDAEVAELHGGGGGVGLDMMDFRSCLKGVHQSPESMDFYSHCDDLFDLVRSMRRYDSHRHSRLEELYTALERMATLRVRIKTLRHLLSHESLALFPDFLQRKDVLRALRYVDVNDSVTLKGRVACEVNTCDELIATEMVFEGVLDHLEPPQIAALLSCLVFQEKTSEVELSLELPDALLEACEALKEIATNLGRLQRDLGLRIDASEYCDSNLKWGLVHVLYDWARGVPFRHICLLTTVQEGSIVRCITRLDELCREVRNCAQLVGNPQLFRKMETVAASIRRDIVFASSLYIS